MRKKLIIIGLGLVFIGFIATTLRFHKRMPSRGYCDFHVWYTTAQRLITAEDLYILGDEKAPEFRYPPFAAAIMTPLALFDKHTAGLLWHVMSFWLLFLCFRLTSRIIASRQVSPGKGFAFHFILAALLGRIILYNFDSGQANIPMLFLALLSVYFYKRSKPVISGIFLGASGMIKFMSALLWPYFLLKKHFKVALAAAICALILFFSTIPLVGHSGVDGGVDYLNNMMQYMHQSSFTNRGEFPYYLDFKNFGFMRLAHMYLAPTNYKINFLSLSHKQVDILIIAFIILLYLFVLWRPKYNSLDSQKLEAVDFSLIFLFMAYFNPNAWMHAYIFLLVPYACMIYYLLRINFRDIFVLVSVIISYVLISIFTPSTVGDKLSHFADVRCFVAWGVLPILFSLIKIKLNKKYLSLAHENLS